MTHSRRLSSRAKLVIVLSSVAVLLSVAALIYAEYSGDVPLIGTETTGGVYNGRSVQNLESSGEQSETILGDGDTFDLTAVPVKKEVGGRAIRMYGYNGQIPGLTLRVKQGSSVTVNFTNLLGFDTTVHWHGLRLDNEFDGVPHVTQDPVRDGGSFRYELKFPDHGVYWYHPHVREDLQQELGLYGMIIVEPSDGNVYGRADAEETVFLDDIRMGDEDIEFFSNDHARFALMGRFGNVPFVDGNSLYEADAEAGDVVRFYFVNSANVRTFNVSFDGAVMKIVGGDSGRYQREIVSDSFVVSPGERIIAEVIFETPGDKRMIHATPRGTVQIGVVHVSERTSGDAVRVFVDSPPAVGFPDKSEIARHMLRKPDVEVELLVGMSGMMSGDMGGMDHSMRGGMMGGTSGDTIEWEDDMAVMNAASTSDDVRWVIRDVLTGEENDRLEIDAKVGDRMKLRISNPGNSMHPMQHPIHIHGQRFLVLSEDGRMNDNLVWKDVVLVRKGSVVDLMVDFTNPGDWVIHCHIPEHMESGMMSMFRVSE